MTVEDYEIGTAYIMLAKDDFKNPSRFDDLAHFLCKDGETLLQIPVFPKKANVVAYDKRNDILH